jgi:hypothetical protein
MDSRLIEIRRTVPFRHTDFSKRIRTIEAAARYINRVGFCWLFAPAGGKAGLPSLFEAVKGRRGVGIEDWDKDSERVWVWKSDLPATRRAYYGKGLAGRPGFVSMSMLPALLACVGGEDLYDLYKQGRISYEAKQIYQALESLGPQPTRALHAASGFDGKDGNTRFHRGLDELQKRLIVMPIGAANEGGAWVSQIFELVARWFPESSAEAKQMDSGSARQSLVLRYLKTVGRAEPRVIASLFGITGRDLDATLTDMTARHLARVVGNWVRDK